VAYFLPPCLPVCVTCVLAGGAYVKLLDPFDDFFAIVLTPFLVDIGFRMW
jgi:hypothetical protein